MLRLITRSVRCASSAANRNKLPKHRLGHESAAEVTPESRVGITDDLDTHRLRLLGDDVTPAEALQYPPDDVVAVPLNDQPSQFHQRFLIVENELESVKNDLAVVKGKVATLVKDLEDREYQLSLLSAREIIKRYSTETILGFFRHSDHFCKNGSRLLHFTSLRKEYDRLKAQTDPDAVEFVDCYNRMIKTYGPALGDVAMLKRLKVGRNDIRHMTDADNSQILAKLEKLDVGHPEWTEMKNSLK